MPPTVAVAAFVFGAVLALIALLGGGFKLFGAEIDGTVGRPVRILAGVAGVALMAIALLTPSGTPSSAPTTASTSEAGTSIAVQPSPAPTSIQAGSLGVLTRSPTMPALPIQSAVTPRAATGTVLLHTTLDDTAAISAPLVGQGGTLINVADSDFVAGKVGNAVDFVREDLVCVSGSM